MPKIRLTYGMGINNANYPVEDIVDSVRTHCNFHQTWVQMLKRCYSEYYHKTRPTYIGCSVDKSWLYFMTFRSWMLEQDYHNKALDKDILVPGNKIYGPDTCCFVDIKLNNFVLDNKSSRGQYKLGVTKHGNKFRAQCNNPITGDRGYLGLFLTEDEAHAAYKKEKARIALELAKAQPDPRVAKALVERFAPLD